MLAGGVMGGVIGGVAGGVVMLGGIEAGGGCAPVIGFAGVVMLAGGG